MTWADFYLVCFVVGFAFSVLSFLAGGVRWHLPGISHGGHGFTAGQIHHVSGAAQAHAGGVRGGGLGEDISPFNFPTLTAFLAWFGGVGYLLSRYSTVWFLFGLSIALLSGIGGACVVYFFIAKVLSSREETMDPADYEMVGVLGKISNPIREGGTGEIIYSQAGTRRTCGARSEEGRAIPKGSEIVVTRYEKGIAYVRLWDELTGEPSAEAAGQKDN